jgi:hypothetical protein
MSDKERRTIVEDRRRQSDRPHPDQILECMGVLEFYGGDPGPMGEDVIRRILVAAQAWTARRDHEERQHAQLRDSVSRWAGARKTPEQLRSDLEAVEAAIAAAIRLRGPQDELDLLFHRRQQVQHQLEATLPEMAR